LAVNIRRTRAEGINKLDESFRPRKVVSIKKTSLKQPGFHGGRLGSRLGLAPLQERFKMILPMKPVGSWIDRNKSDSLD
jgi:hypothetical protein